MIEPGGRATEDDATRAPKAKMRENGSSVQEKVQDIDFGDDFDKTPVVGGELITPTARLDNEKDNLPAKKRGWLRAITHVSYKITTSPERNLVEEQNLLAVVQKALETGLLTKDEINAHLLSSDINLADLSSSSSETISKEVRAQKAEDQALAEQREKLVGGIVAKTKEEIEAEEHQEASKDQGEEDENITRDNLKQMVLSPIAKTVRNEVIEGDPDSMCLDVSQKLAQEYNDLFDSLNLNFQAEILFGEFQDMHHWVGIKERGVENSDGNNHFIYVDASADQFLDKVQSKHKKIFDQHILILDSKVSEETSIMSSFFNPEFIMTDGNYHSMS